MGRKGTYGKEDGGRLSDSDLTQDCLFIFEMLVSRTTFDFQWKPYVGIYCIVCSFRLGLKELVIIGVRFIVLPERSDSGWWLMRISL